MVNELAPGWCVSHVGHHIALATVGEEKVLKFKRVRNERKI
jgi:hypothetical protein